jgi:hypothetical protein
MKYWFRLFLLLGSIIAIIALIGSLLPRSYDFKSQVDITAPANVVFEELNKLPNWKDWSQWNPKEIPGLEVNYTGPESGVGATQKWTDIRGEGKLWITKSVANETIEYEMLFANFPLMLSQLELVSDELKTTVTWSSSGRLPGGPFYGFFAPFFSTHMQNEYEKSLEKLKAKIEGTSNEVAANEAATSKTDAPTEAATTTSE